MTQVVDSVVESVRVAMAEVMLLRIKEGRPFEGLLPCMQSLRFSGQGFACREIDVCCLRFPLSISYWLNVGMETVEEKWGGMVSMYHSKGCAVASI